MVPGSVQAGTHNGGSSNEGASMSDTSHGPRWWIASDGRCGIRRSTIPIDGTIGGRFRCHSRRTAHRLTGQLSSDSWCSHGRATSGGLSTSGWCRVSERIPTEVRRHNSGGPATFSQDYQSTAPSSGGRISRGLRLLGIGFTMAGDEPGLMMVPGLRQAEAGFRLRLLQGTRPAPPGCHSSRHR